MKKIILSMLAVSVITVSAFAQTDENTEKRAHKAKHERGDKHSGHQKKGDHFKDLNLTDAQKQQMKTANERFHQQMKDLQKNENITVKQQKEQREALAKQHKASIDNILTAEQKAKAKNMKKDHADKAGKKGDYSAKMMGDRSHKAAKELDLTADQSTKFKSLNDNFRTKAKAIQQDGSLSKEQKKTQFESLQKQHKNELNSVLTKEQREKFKTSRKDKGGRKAAI